MIYLDRTPWFTLLFLFFLRQMACASFPLSKVPSRVCFCFYLHTQCNELGLTMQRIRTHGKFQGEKCDLSPAIILGKADVLSSFRLCLLGCLSADMGVSIFKCQTSVGGVCGGERWGSW